MYLRHCITYCKEIKLVNWISYFMSIIWKYGAGHECLYFRDGFRIFRRLASGHNRVEAIMIIRRVRDSPDGSICFNDRILSFNDIPISFLPCRFGVASVSIDYAIIEGILGISLVRNETSLHLEIFIFLRQYRHVPATKISVEEFAGEIKK